MISVATRQNKLASSLGRFWGFLKLLLSKKKSAFGLAIITLFLVVAVVAPLITPYTTIGEDPSSPLFPLSAPSIAPVWLRHFPTWLGGNPKLSENMLIVKNPGLPRLTPEGEWNFRAEGYGAENVTTEVLTDKGFPKAPIPFTELYENGSFAIKFSRQRGTLYNETKVRLFLEFEYPYTGPLGRFIGNIEILVKGTTITETVTERRNVPPFDWITYDTDLLAVPVRVKVFLGRVGGREWKVWPSPFLFGGSHIPMGFEKDETTIVYDPKIPDLEIAAQPKWVEKSAAGPASGGWITARSGESKAGHIDSDSLFLVNELTEFGDQSFPHRIVFTDPGPDGKYGTADDVEYPPGKYVFGIELIFVDQKEKAKDKDVEITVFIDDFGLFFHGTSFGFLGTDHYGRDLFAQLVYGTRISLYLGLTVAVLTVTIGLAVGLAAGYLGRVVDEVLMRITDMLLVLPGLPLLIVLMAIMGAKLENLIILLGLLGWMSFARLIRSQVLSLRERPFVEAAKAVGAGRIHIIINHILPSVMSLVYIVLATSVPGAITAEAALAWLGFFDPQRMSWGRMLHDIFEAKALTNWWWIFPPGLCIAMVAVSFILLGFALDEVLNPKLRLRK